MKSKFKLTKVWARKNLKAVEELIKRYKDPIYAEKAREDAYDRRYHGCPLCQLCEMECEKCPWVIYKGLTCVAFNWGDEKQCLSRLYGWKRRLQNIINKEA